MKKRYEGKVAWITGGGSGIGREICKRLAEEGVAVGIVDINPAGGEETVSQIEATGGKAVLDGSDESFDELANNRSAA